MHILIVRNNSNPQAIDASLLLAAYLNSQGLAYTLLNASEFAIAKEADIREKIGGLHFDMAVVLGGDGTILRTARLVGTTGTPILGINFGNLGFLANSSEDGVVAIVSAALAGDVVQELRSNLRIDVLCEDDKDCDLPSSYFDDEKSNDESSMVKLCDRRSFFALNELAITRGSLGRVIDFHLKIAGVSLASMRGDGVVVATATGSTAYALSAGGPLVAPGFDGLVVVPLAPHTLHSRAVVTAGSDTVEIDLTGDPQSREATLFTDGELLELSSAPTKICVRKGAKPTTLLRYKCEGFYEHAAKVFFR